jgi:transposase
MDILDFTTLLSIENYVITSCEKDDVSQSLNFHLEPTTSRVQCSKCGNLTTNNSRHTHRVTRDIPNGIYMKVYLHYEVIDYKCPFCKGYTHYSLPLVSSHARVTDRFRMYIGKMCNLISPKEVSEEFDLDDNTVYRYEKYFLEQKLSAVNFDNLVHIGVDEISFRKGHKYMTIVYDMTSGKAIPIFYAKGKTKEALQSFYDKLNPEQKNTIKTVNMDMSTSYIPCTEENLKNVDIVIDKFHVIKELNRRVEEERKELFTEIYKKDKEVFNGNEKKKSVGRYLNAPKI